MAYAIREGPVNYGGAAITSIVNIQEIAYEWAQHQLGWDTPILEDVTSDLPHLEERWLKLLREYLKKIDASIEIYRDMSYPLQKYGDVHLMPKIIQCLRFKEKEIQQINYCRLYLNVTTLADITDATGKLLDPQMYQGQVSLLSSTAKSFEVNQKKSGIVSWRLWRTAMKIWADNKTLRKPLG
eukprot:9313934-Ditylum_brightwellii.AAC.1